MLTDGRTDGRTHGRTDGRTDDGRKVITIAHPEQSSGELKMTFALCKDSDQPGNLPSLITLYCAHGEILGHQLPIECTAKTAQTG